MNPRFIVHDAVGRTWHFESEAQVLGFVALKDPEYVAYYRDDYVAKLKAENARLQADLDRIWDGCLELSIMRDVFMKALGEVSPEAEAEAWIEINRRINAMNAKARKAATAGEGGGACR